MGIGSVGVAVVNQGGAQSCAAFPSFPDAGCTGVPPGTNLTPLSMDVDGNFTVNTNNTTLDGVSLPAGDGPAGGCVLVHASGVTIKNSVVPCVQTNGNATAENPANPPVIVQDTTMNCARSTTTENGTAIIGVNIRLVRVDIADCENAGNLDHDDRVTDSYIHDLYQCQFADCHEASNPHTDGFETADGDNNQFVHNTIQAYTNPCRNGGTFDLLAGNCNGNAAINIKNNATGSSDNVLIQKNLLSGGATTLLCPQGTSSTNFSIDQNHFKLVGNDTFGLPSMAAFTVSGDCVGTETWTSNTIEDNGHTVNADQRSPY